MGISIEIVFMISEPGNLKEIAEVCHQKTALNLEDGIQKMFANKLVFTQVIKLSALGSVFQQWVKILLKHLQLVLTIVMALNLKLIVQAKLISKTVQSMEDMML